MKHNKWITFYSWASLIAIWFILSGFNIVPSYKLPSPVDVLLTMKEIFFEGYNNTPFLNHLGISLYRLIVSIILSIFTAIPLGLLSGYLPKVRSFVNSFINFYRNLPPLAYYSLLIIWMGIDEESKIALLFLASFAPMYISSLSAVSRVNPSYILGAKTLGANSIQIFFTVILPACIPEVFVGIKTAVGVAYTTLVSAEMIAATAGIGWIVIDAYKYINTEVVFVGIIVMGITGLLIDYVLTLIEKKVIFWNGK